MGKLRRRTIASELLPSCLVLPRVEREGLEFILPGNDQCSENRRVFGDVNGGTDIDPRRLEERLALIRLPGTLGQDCPGRLVENDAVIPVL